MFSKSHLNADKSKTYLDLRLESNMMVRVEMLKSVTL